VTEAASQPVYSFEGFRLDAQRRVLFGLDGQPIALTPRLLDALLYLVERPGQLIAKERLLEDLWPNVVVEEHNLNKTISELRRVLGEKPSEHKFIVTKAGRGYRFVAEVAIESRAAEIGAREHEQSTTTLRNEAVGSKSKFVLAAIALAVAALVFGAIQAYLDGGEPVAGEQSVAVLPFVDLSATGDQAWLADGLAEGILNALARLPELKVTARTSSFQFKERTTDIREIAALLGVTSVLEGSVQLVGENLRVTARLIRAADGFQLWSSTYDGTTSDLFAFERDVAERVAAALDVVLDEEQRTRMFASGTRNVEAFREYQQGWRVYNLVHARETDQTLWDANRHFERAMMLDPQFAQAAEGRTDAFAHLLVQPLMSYVANSPYSRDDALVLLRQNFDFITENSPDATTRLATEIHRESFSPTWDRMRFLLMQLRQQWDIDEFAFGGGVDSASWLPGILWIAGQHDLVRTFAEKHVLSDPLSPEAWIQRVGVEIHARDFGAARALLAQGRRNLGPASLRNEEIQIELLDGRRDEAIALMDSFPNRDTAMVIAALKGDEATAMSIADERETRYGDQPPGRFLNALLYTYHELGAAERARVLVKRIDESPVGAPIFIVLLAENGGELYFDLNDAPNFVAKLKRAGIDPASLKRASRLSTLH